MPPWPGAPTPKPSMTSSGGLRGAVLTIENTPAGIDAAPPAPTEVPLPEPWAETGGRAPTCTARVAVNVLGLA